MTNKINVLHVDNTKTFGGAINSLVNLVNAMNAELYNHIVLTAQPREGLAKQIPKAQVVSYNPRLMWESALVKKLKAHVPKGKLLSIGVTVLIFIFWQMFVTLPETIKICNIVKKYKIDIIHLNNILACQLSGLIAALVNRCPCVVHMRDFEEIGIVTKKYAKLVKKFVAVSEAVKQNVLKLDVSENNVCVIHNSVGDIVGEAEARHVLRDEFGVSEGTPTFAIFGRIIRWKGILEFISAARIVMSEMPEARAVIVGDCSDGNSEYLEEVLQLINNYNLTERIVFTGFRKDALHIMSEVDVVVHASTKPEPFGRVVIEGMINGKAVIATKAGGPLDIITNAETGVLVDCGDINAMAEEILRLLREPATRISIGNAARRHALQYFTNESHAAKMEQVFLRALGVA